ncbi:MAG: hypothetical protein CVT47_01715 [Thermoplasmata archaeon HGW-Thermoplasmata-2]|nr:MAG: hypothetical protein CVT47_01715 [Thermoplasmata archaeon HGW-Thermoplasmata-2]
MKSHRVVESSSRRVLGSSSPDSKDLIDSGDLIDSRTFKCVFFDLDGTLTDSKNTILRCLNATLSKFGYSTYAEEEIFPLIGTLHRKGMFFRKAGQIDESTMQKMVEFYNEIYMRTYTQDTRIFPGIVEMLEALKGAGILAGAITIKKGLIARRLIDEMGLGRYIDVVVGDGDAKLKPAPDAIFTACRALGVDPRECVMVGDAVGDIVAGKVAGCKTIGVTWGAATPEALAKAGADRVAKGTDVLRSLLLPDEIIRRGAEAEIHKTVFMGRVAVQKRRVPKSYRIPQVDAAIREARTKEEVKLIAAARAAGVGTPRIYDVDLAASSITMEFVDGKRAKEAVEDKNTTPARRKALCRNIGACAAKLHSAGIIHGDLTTSNIIVRADGKSGGTSGGAASAGGRSTDVSACLPSLCFIDFGLGEFSKEIEKQGVDLHVLMEAFESTHSRFPYCFGEVMKGYKAKYAKGAEVEEKIKEIVKRGRYMRSHE